MSKEPRKKKVKTSTDFHVSVREKIAWVSVNEVDESQVPDVVKDIISLKDSLPLDTTAIAVELPSNENRFLFEEVLLRSGFVERTQWYVLFLRKGESVDACSKFIYITRENFDDYTYLLPTVESLCPGYLSKHEVKTSLVYADRILIVLVDDDERICAAALVSYDEDNLSVDISYLCSAVKGAGRKLFDKVAQDAYDKKFTTLQLMPANSELGKMYTNWMGDRYLYLPEETDLSMFLSGPSLRVDSYQDAIFVNVSPHVSYENFKRIQFPEILRLRDSSNEYAFLVHVTQRVLYHHRPDVIKMFTAAGFVVRDQNFVFVRSEECKDIITIPLEHLYARREILKEVLKPVNFCICPGKNFLYQLATGADLMITLANKKGLPCAVSFVSFSDFQSLCDIKIICSVVKGSGKKLFDTIVQLSREKGYHYLKMTPSDQPSKTLFQTWMSPIISHDKLLEEYHIHPEKDSLYMKL